jgi:hypothetical protein
MNPYLLAKKAYENDFKGHLCVNVHNLPTRYSIFNFLLSLRLYLNFLLSLRLYLNFLLSLRLYINFLLSLRLYLNFLLSFRSYQGNE